MLERSRRAADGAAPAVSQAAEAAGTVVGRTAAGKARLGQRQPSVSHSYLDPRPRAAHMAAMLIETETTPNPATLKFLPGRAVMPSGTRDFATPEEAEASPLAEAIYNLGDVTGVFFGSDFVSVTAAPGVDWSGLKPDVLAILLDHFSADMPLFKPASAGFSVGGGEESFADDPADA